MNTSRYSNKLKSSIDAVFISMPAHEVMDSLSHGRERGAMQYNGNFGKAAWAAVAARDAAAASGGDTLVSCCFAMPSSEEMAAYRRSRMPIVVDGKVVPAPNPMHFTGKFGQLMAAADAAFGGDAGVHAPAARPVGE